MKDKKINLYSENLLRIFILLFPVVELITSFMILKTSNSLTIGMIYKTFLLVYGVIYILFVNKNKRILVTSITLCIVSFSIINLVLTIENWSIGLIIEKISWMLKFLTFPLMTIFFILYYKNGNKLPIRTFVDLSAMFAIVMVMAGITNTALPSYDFIEQGHTGWFYSANELGVLFVIFLPIVIKELLTTKSVYSIVSFGLNIYALLTIGTKASLLGLILTLFALLTFCFILLILKDKHSFNTIIKLTCLTLIIFAIFLPIAPSFKHIKADFGIKVEGNQNVDRFIYSGRQQVLEDYSAKFNEADIIQKFVGIKDEVKNLKNGEYKLIERDFYDLLFNFGVVGLLIYLSIIIFIFVKFIYSIFFKFKKNCSIDNFCIGFCALMSIAAAFVSGHVLVTPTLSILVAIVFADLDRYSYINLKEQEKSKRNVMFICSVGGHLTQMLQLKGIFKDYNYVLITEKTDVTKDMKKKMKIRYLLHGSRQYMFTYILKETYNFFKSIIYFIYYNPEIIVTTGTHTAVPMCYIGKFFGRKVIFIESFAKRNSPTKSGKIVYPIADIFVIQWDSLKEIYPKAEIWGWIY
ncbi:MAG: O-antigen ligase family protein [Clostridia bacterium]|nr:O-antigen ligase family protein [Clostridia bacterium]